MYVYVCMYDIIICMYDIIICMYDIIICMYVCIYVCMCVCVYVYLHGSSYSVPLSKLLESCTETLVWGTC